MSSFEVAENIRAIARILTSSNPNLRDLRNRENCLKNKYSDIDCVEILGLLAENPTETVLALQFLERGLRRTGPLLLNPQSLFPALKIFLNNPTTPAIVRRHVLSIMSIAILRSIRPESLMEFLSQELSISDLDKMEILIGIPCLATDDGLIAIVKKWSFEVFPSAARSRQISLIEKWIPFVSAAEILHSGLLMNIDLPSIEDYADIVRECCKKEDLIAYMKKLISAMLQSGNVDHILLGASFIGNLCLGNDSLELLISTTNILNGSLSLPKRIEFAENCLGLLEKSLFTLTSPLLEWILIATTFPPDVDNYSIKLRGDHDDEFCPESLHLRFLEIREDMRQILRTQPFADGFESMILSAVNRLSYFPNWRQSEAILHACSAFSRRFPSLAVPLIQYLRNINTKSTHRAILNALMVALTAFLKNIQDEDINLVCRFALICLSTFATSESTGWFKFRSKQDNSCVVLLQALVSNGRRLDSCIFLSDLEACINGIKLNFYGKDTFRQSRSIFVRSIVDLASHHNSVEQILTKLLPLICEDCLDISDFLSRAVQYKDSLFHLIQPLLDTFIAHNSEGVESVLAYFCYKLGWDELINAICILKKSGGFRVDQWMDVAPIIASFHGPRFIVLLSSLVDTPRVSPDWVRNGLMSVPIDSDFIQFHIQQLERLLSCNISASLFLPVSDYVVLMLKTNGQKSAQLIRPFISFCVKQAGRNFGSESANILIDLNKLIGTDYMGKVLKECFSKHPKEAASLASGIEEGNNSKCRRIMKKLALAID